MWLYMLQKCEHSVAKLHLHQTDQAKYILVCSTNNVINIKMTIEGKQFPIPELEIGRRECRWADRVRYLATKMKEKTSEFYRSTSSLHSTTKCSPLWPGLITLTLAYHTSTRRPNEHSQHPPTCLPSPPNIHTASCTSFGRHGCSSKYSLQPRANNPSHIIQIHINFNWRVSSHLRYNAHPLQMFADTRILDSRRCRLCVLWNAPSEYCSGLLLSFFFQVWSKFS